MSNKKKTQETITKPAVERTSAGLRDAIFDEIDALRSGQSSPTRANALAKLSASIVETVRLEVEVAKLERSAPAAVKASAEVSPLGGPLKLSGGGHGG